MKSFFAPLGEIWGLFVEDPSFTLGMIVCLIIAVYALPHMPVPSAWRGPVLFVLLAIVLLENVVRSARAAQPLLPSPVGGNDKMAEEKKVTETTTKTKNDSFGDPKEQKTVTTEKKSNKDSFGDQKQTTKTTEKVEKR